MPNFRSILTLILLGSGLFAGGCAQNVDGTWKAPFVYRIDVQQGNVIEQEMINKLKPGMDKTQVKFIMGTPMISDPFHSNRWDYVYSYEPGSGDRQQRRVTLYFKDDKLSHVDGNIQVTDTPVSEEEIRKDRSVEVPLELHEEGFFSRLFGGDEPDKEETVETVEEPSEEEQAEATAEMETDTDKTDTALVEEPATEKTDVEEPQAESVAVDEAPASEETTAGDNKYKWETTDTETETTTSTSGLQSEQDKNLLKRFWDRMTSDKSESGIQEGEESERDRRDAEVFEDAGGNL